MSSFDSFDRPPNAGMGEDPSGPAAALDAARAGDFRLEIGEVAAEAWSLLTGSKRVILVGVLLTLMISAVANGVSTSLEESESGSAMLLSFGVALAGGFVSYVINAGLILFAIKRAAGDPSASFDDLFACFPIFWKIVGLNVLQAVLILVGLFLFVLPGIYLMVAYLMALPLVAERGLGIWEALETSRQALTHCWFRMLGMSLLLGLVVAVGGVLTAGIALIWLLPFMGLCFGVAYREIFGYSGSGPR